MTHRTLFDKIWDAHVVAEADGEPALLYVDLHLVHEVTSPQAFEGLRMEGRPVRQPGLVVATMDHNVPTTGSDAANVDGADEMSVTQMDTLRRNCDEAGIACFGAGHRWQGIVHVIGPELGLTLPGSVIVCGDSHTATHGAFGAFALGIGTSEVEHVLATQCLRQARPLTMEVRIEGTLPPGVTAKDTALGVLERDRDRRCGGPRRGVHRSGGARLLDGAAHDALQPDHRRRWPRGHDRSRRRDDRVHREPPLRSARRAVGCCGCRVERAAQRSGRALRPLGDHRRGDARADGDVGNDACTIGSRQRTRSRSRVVLGRSRA